MQMQNTQASGLEKFLQVPDKEYDTKVFSSIKPVIEISESLKEQPMREFPNVPAMIAEARIKIDRTNRLNKLVDIADFIGESSLLERKHILNEIIDKSNIEGDCDVSHLEDAAVDFTKAIEYQAQQAKCQCNLCV